MPEALRTPWRHPLAELTLARVRELVREPEAIFWVFVFPILLTAILALAFRSRPPEPLPVAVVEGARAEGRLAVLGREADLAAQKLGADEARRAWRGDASWWWRRRRRAARLCLRPDPAREPGRASRGGFRPSARRRPHRRLRSRPHRNDRAGRALRGLPGAKASWA